MTFLKSIRQLECVSRRNLLIGLGAVALAVLSRLVLGRITVGNFDTDSYKVVAQLVDDGKSVYANTSRYNYGPWWSWILWLFWRIANHLAFPNAFHFCITAFLTVVDVAIAWILAVRFSPKAALFFLLCPVSILITGIQGQFDNLAVLLGLIAWIIITPKETKPSFCRFFAGALLVGLSISVKHILAFFPLWVMLCPSFGSLRHRMIFPLVAYAVFLAGFLPWVGDPASLNGIVHHVFLYGSDTRVSLMTTLVNLLFPFKDISDNLPAPWDRIMGHLPGMAAWAFSIFWLGWWTGRHRPTDLFFVYLLGLVGLSASMADQYLAIPLVACAVFYRCWPVWLYTAVATFHLVFSRNNLGDYLASQFHWAVFNANIPMYPQAQLWIIVLLILFFLGSSSDARSPGVSSSKPADADGNSTTVQTGP
jgi:hypothetical protein